MCDCIKETNEKLIENGINTQLDIPFVFTREGNAIEKTPRILIATCKADISKKEKAMKIRATYCPFCGEKYPDSK